MPGTKQVRIISKYTNYPLNRVIVTDNDTADKWVREGDAEYINKQDTPEPKRGPGRPRKEMQVAAVQPADIPGGGILKKFKKPRS